MSIRKPPSALLRSAAPRQTLALFLLLLLPAIAAAIFSSSLVRSARAVGEETGAATEDTATQTHARENAAEAYGKLPLQFEANKGQADERVRFVARGDGYVLFLTSDEAVMTLRPVAQERAGEKASTNDTGTKTSMSDSGKKTSTNDPARDAYKVLRMRLAGANRAPSVEGLEESSGKLNYFLGSDPAKWRTGVALYNRVLYRGVYPGVDLVYYGNRHQLEYDFHVTPGIDPNVIKLQFDGAAHAKIDNADKSLVLAVGGGEVRLKRPVIYQVTGDGGRKEIEGGYRVKGGEVEFRVGRYDASKPLVIDPVLSYSTFLGGNSGTSGSSGLGIAVDSTGSAYVTGNTGSFAFPAPGVKLIPASTFNDNVFITKLAPNGSSLIYTAFLGGGSDDRGLGIALDASGSAYVTGRTTSNNFPTFKAMRSNDNLLKSIDGGASWKVSNNGLGNIPVTRMWADPLSPSILYALTFEGIYKTTDGGANWNLLITSLNSPGFTFASALALAPSSPSTIYAGNAGPSAKVIKSTDGGNTWASANGGLPGLSITGLSVDPTNPSIVFAGTYFDVYKTTDGGASWSKANTGLTFGGITNFVFDPTNTLTVYAVAGGGGGVFKSTNGGASWSSSSTGITTIGIRNLVIDPTNSSTLYAVTGLGIFKTTNAGTNWSPVNNGLTNLNVFSLAYDPAAPSTLYAGTNQSSIFKTTNGGANWTLVHSGLPGPVVQGLAVSTASHVYAGIDTSQTTSRDDGEAFVAKLTPAGDALIYSTYLGGAGNDEGDSIAVGSGGDAYVTGQTASSDFPIAGPRASSLKGTSDAFVTRLNADGSALVYSTFVGGTNAEAGRSLALDAAGNAYFTGETSSNDFPVTPGAFSTTFSGSSPFFNGNDGFVARLDAAGSALTYATYLGGNGEDRGAAIALDSSGNAYVAGLTSSTNFPTLNPVQATGKGFNDAFVTKLNSSGSALVYSTYLGGTQGESARGIAVDSTGSAYVTGSTGSDNFPVTPGTLRNRSPLYRTTDSGANWSNDNYGLDSSAIRDLAVNPLSPLVIYAATDNGVFKSTNGGRNWAASNNGLTILRVTVLAIDPSNPSTIYAGTSPGTFNTPTVFKSTDGGASWSPLDASKRFQFVAALAIDPSNPSNIYLSDNSNLFKSTDGGVTWGNAAAGLPGTAVFIAVDPSNSSIIYAASLNSSGGVFKSTDGGTNWSPANTGLPNFVGVGRVAIDPAHPSTLFAQTTSGVFKSIDGAASWTQSLKGQGVAGPLVIDPSDSSTIYAVAAQQTGFNTSIATVFKSTDGGATWRASGNGIPYRVSALAIDPLTRSNVFAAIDTFGITDNDAFLVKFAPSGNSFAYSTIIGGLIGDSNSNGNAKIDFGVAVAVDSEGAAYVTGASFTPDFPTTPDAFLPFNRGADAFVMKVVAAPSIGGVVTNSGGVPQSGVKVTLTGASTASFVTGSDGAYLFVNLLKGGTYTVGATKPGSAFTPPSQTFTNLNANQTANFTLSSNGVPSHNIHGRITDANGMPTGGATVALSGSQTEFTTTDSAGNYLFNAPDGGNYTVTPTALGFIFSPPSRTINGLASDQTLDFTATRQNFVVTNANDSGAGSLRQAILDANATAGRDTIVFHIPGHGVQTVFLRTALPVISDPVTIDAATQPGFVGFPLVGLNGAAISNSTGAPGLLITVGDSVVRGLNINSFPGNGITITGGGGNRIEGNIIGLDPTGSAKRPNKGDGIAISQSSANIIGGTSLVQRNVISGNEGNGISITGDANQVKGNLIGTDIEGTAALGNGGGNFGGSGVSLPNLSGQSSNGNIIGGTEPGARNIISGNSSNGIDASNGTIIQGNYIGTNIAAFMKLPNANGIRVNGTGVVIGGTTPEARNIISGNAGAGVTLNLSFNNPALTLKGNYIGTDATGTLKLGNMYGVSIGGAATIGGTEPGAGNVISGNDQAGVFLGSGITNGAKVKGNFIGTDASGTLPLGNFTGVDLQASQVVVGGSEPGARNVISGNLIGLSLGGSTSVAFNVVQGNLIGTDATGTAPLPNIGEGVTIREGSDNRFGGDAPGEGNTVAFNGSGVTVIFPNGGPLIGVNNSIRGNSIFSNATLGIDLLSSIPFVTPNDAGDADEGANHLQNFPVLSSITNVAGGTNVKGTLDSKPNTQFAINFYTDLACDPSGNGEGARPFGTTTVTTDANGKAAIDITLAGLLAARRTITATATDPAGNTSEFSPCDASVTSGSVEFRASEFDVLEDVGSFPVKVVRTGGTRGTLTVNYSTGAGTATAGSDYTPASGTLTFADGETEKTFSISIADDGVTEPEETVRLTLSGTPEVESLGAKALSTIHIFDSNTPLELYIGPDDVDIIEGNVGHKTAFMPVTLSAATSRTVTVDFATRDDLGMPGVDFLPVSGTLTFAPGEQFKSIPITIISDTMDEFNELIGIDISNPVNATIIFPEAFVRVLDDDAPPSLSVTDVSVAESAAGSKAVFTVHLSSASGKGATATYATADGTATAGSDYTATSGVLNFSPGETLKTVEVPILNDAVAETDETFFLNVNSTSLTRATVADGQGQATIIDSSSTSASFVQFGAASYSVNESDNQIQVSVTRTGNTSNEATINYQTESQSASDRLDFTASFGTLRFAPGETQKSFTVLVTDDRFKEDAESLNLILSNPVGVLLGSPSVVALTINSEDAADGESPVRDASFDSRFFVRQHYHDFLNREPDEAGLQFWTQNIEGCGTDAHCREVKKINVSAAFFLSIEFQETGYLVYRTYKAAYGDATSPNVSVPVPGVRLQEFLPDSQRIGQNVQVGIGTWEQQLEANKNAYMVEFVRRQRFNDAFPSTMTPAQFVDKLNQNAGQVLSQAERDQLVTELAASPDAVQGRASVLRKVAEDADMRRNEKNRAFVLMQYFGYLRRNPDDPQDTDFRGWKFWLDKLDQFNGDFVRAEMVRAFITSDEYRNRFGL